MNRYCADLALPVVVDLEPFTTRKHDAKALGHFSESAERLNPQLREWLYSIAAVEISHCEVFYTPPRSRLPIHVDGDKLCEIVKLNWQLGAQGSMMNWFRLKDSSVQVPKKQTGINTSYLLPQPEQCVLVHSAKIGTPTLVNVGQPHSVLNQTSEPRWVLSAVLSRRGSLLQMPEALSVFTGHLK